MNQYLSEQDLSKIDRTEISTFIKYYQTQIKAQQFEPKNRQDLEILKFNKQLQQRKTILKEQSLEKFGNIGTNSEDIKKINDMRFTAHDKQSQISIEESKQVNEIDDSRQQELHREGLLLKDTYSMNVNQIEDTEKIIFELSTLLQQFSSKVLEQENMTVLISQQAEEAVHNVVQGNKELEMAKEYQRGNGFIFAAIFMIFTVTIWLWEYVHTRYY